MLGKTASKAGIKITTKKSLTAKKLIQKYSKDFNRTLNDIDTIVQIRARWHKSTVSYIS